MEKSFQIESLLNIFSDICDNINEGLIITNEDNEIIGLNKECENITGYSKNELIGKNPRIFFLDGSNQDVFDNILRTLQTNNFWIGELQNRHKDGVIYTSIAKIYKYIDISSDKTFYYSIFSDITSVSSSENNELFYLAYHDPLTALPNRLKLKAQVEYVINNSKRNNLKFALLFLDLDNFKDVNDTHGHNFGDRLLVDISTKFKSSIRSNDMIARVGGDEFIVVLSDIKDHLFTERICNKILAIVKKARKFEDKDLDIGVSIGISIYPENGDNIEELIHNADSAMYQVKHNGKNYFELFSKDMNKKLLKQTLKDKELTNAVNNDEFVLHYQPEMDINTKEVFSLEILTRWNHVEKGLVLPGSFIPDLEISNLIFDFEELILTKSCMQLKSWHDKDFFKGSISVNISTKYLEYGKLFKTVKKVLELSNLEPKFLVLEFDEQAIMNVSKESLEQLEKMSKMGVVLSIDNFGKSFISYDYLKECFISRLKIDRSYIDLLIEENSDEEIVMSIINLAQHMGISVIAEGIEVPLQNEFVLKSACSKVQGYYYARPMDSVKFEDWYSKLSYKKN